MGRKKLVEIYISPTNCGRKWSESNWWRYIYSLSTMAHFNGKKSRFFLNIILERKLTAALGEKLKNMFKIKK